MTSASESPIPEIDGLRLGEAGTYALFVFVVGNESMHPCELSDYASGLA